VPGPVSRPARAGFVSGEMSCCPGDCQNGCSTTNRLWKSSKHGKHSDCHSLMYRAYLIPVSSPPAYLQSEGTTAPVVEKEAHSKVSRIV